MGACLGIEMFRSWFPVDFDLTKKHYGNFLWLKAIAIRVGQIKEWKASGRETFAIAKSIHADFGVKFGDPAYSWTVGAAIELADEFMEDR